MKKVIMALLFLLIYANITAQKKTPATINIPMTAERWQFKADQVKFEEYKSHAALHLLNSTDAAILKDLTFSNGTIEFDWAPEDPFFAGMYFRRKDSLETECFYLRVRAGSIPGAMQAVQYAPFLDGVNLWDMLPDYQGNAVFKAGEWNHIKLVISGSRMIVFVNDMERPALQIPQLMGNTASGGLAFDGKGFVANLVIKPEQTGELASSPDFDPVHNDPRYLRQWSVSQPVALPITQEPYTFLPPKIETTWQPVVAERLGLINLTRLYGKSKERRIVWLKVKLRVAAAQVREVSLGFSDEIWAYVNGQPVYFDKNLFGTPHSKFPLGRCSIENASFKLPLVKGDNEVLIALSNFFYGWGLIARLDMMDGIEVMP